MLVSFGKLILRSVFLLIATLFFSKFLLLPIAEYFWPPSPSISPRANLEAILAHTNLLAHIETELQDYLTPTGRDTVSRLFQHMDSLAKEQNEDDDVHVVNKDSNNGTLQAILDNFGTTQFLKVYTLGDRIWALTNSTALESLQANFNILRKYGIVLDGEPKNSGEVLYDDDGIIVSDTQRATDFAVALDKILTLMKDGEELTETISKVAAEIETKLHQDEPLEDMNVAAQVEHFNFESDRLINEMNTVIHKHRHPLHGTREFILNAATRVQDLFDEFQHHQKVYNRDYVKRFDKLLMKLESLSGTRTMHSSSPLIMDKPPNVEL